MNTHEQFRKMVAIAQEKMDTQLYRGGSDLIGEYFDAVNGPSLTQVYQSIRYPNTTALVTVIVDYNLGKQEGIKTLIHEVRETISF